MLSDIRHIAPLDYSQSRPKTALARLAEIDTAPNTYWNDLTRVQSSDASIEMPLLRKLLASNNETSVQLWLSKRMPKMCLQSPYRKTIDSENSRRLQKRSQFSLRTLLSVVTFLALCFALLGYLKYRSRQWEAEMARLAQLDEKTCEQIVKDVEVIRAKLGRAPKDKTELEVFLGRPMPVVHDDGYPVPIHYQRTGDNSFHLYYGKFVDDDRVYDSDMPDAGWVQHWN